MFCSTEMRLGDNTALCLFFCRKYEQEGRWGGEKGGGGQRREGMTHVSLLAFFLCSGNCVALLQHTNQLRRSRSRFAKKKTKNFQLVTAVLKITGRCVGRALLGGVVGWGIEGGVFCQRLIGCVCYPERKKKTLKYSFFCFVCHFN